MANKKEHTNQLLQRYISGDIGAQEEAQLEAYAQEDTFLAEALEGLRTEVSADHRAATKRMRKALPKSMANQRTLNWRRISVAASLLLLLGLSLWMIPQSFNSDGALAMQKEEAPTATVGGDSNTSTDATAPETTVETPAVEAEASPSTYRESTTAPDPDLATADLGEVRNTPDEPAISPPAAAEPATFSATVDPSPTLQEDDFVLSSEPEEIAEEAPPALADTPPPPPAPKREQNRARTASEDVIDGVSSTANAQRSIPANAKVISGYITNAADDALPNAQILLPGQLVGETSDSNGFFQLVTDQSVRKIIITHPEHLQIELDLSTGEQEVRVSLEEASSPNDDDNNWMFEGARSTYFPNQERSVVYPEGGMRALRKAIQENKPADVPLGKVRISFSVQANGSLTDIRILNDNTAPLALSNYVRSYLQQRSTWIVNGGDKPARVSITFRFN